MRLRDSLRHPFAWYLQLSAAARWRWAGRILTVLLVAWCSYNFEDIKEHFPDIITLQLQSYSWLSRLEASRRGPEARREKAQKVVGVEIDNDTFFGCLKEVGDQDVTDRAFLATVINRAVDAKAAVIALDINLASDNLDQDDARRKSENQALFNAIYHAQEKGIPVVLTLAFDDKSMKLLPNIVDHPADPSPPVAATAPRHWDDACKRQVQTASTVSVHPPVQVAGCSDKWPPESNGNGPRAGFDVAPLDRRRVPLALDPADFVTGAENVICPSFALQVADAYETATQTPAPRVMKRLEDRIDEHQFVYTIFLPEYSHFDSGLEPSALEEFLEWTNRKLGLALTRPGKLPDGSPIPQDHYAFDHVSAKDVYNSAPGDAVSKKLEGKILLVGGHRTVRQGSEVWLDYHRAPQGPMLGMYIQANYIEGLLADDVMRPVGRWTAVIIDVGIAIAIMIVMALWAHGFWRKTFVLAVFVAFAFLVYLTGTDRGYCLDFLAVLLIMFVHTAFDHYVHLQEKVHEPSAGSAHA